MPKLWRVMLNSKLWNQEKFENDFYTCPEMRRLAQSKGRCPMKVNPIKDDLVCFVFKGKIVMRGFVESNGFENGTDHQNHSCNIGTNRLHAEPTEFAWVRITEIGLCENIRPSGQRTWAKMPI